MRPGRRACWRPRPSPRRTSVIEIGPGRGALTVPLAGAVAALTAVEIDRDLVPVLRGRLPGARAGDRGRLPRRARRSAVRGARRCAVAGDRQPPLQRVVADPLPAARAGADRAAGSGTRRSCCSGRSPSAWPRRPGTRRYGALSIMVQLDADVEPLLTLPPGAFRPAPARCGRASSACTSGRRRSWCATGGRFESLVRSLFSQRRKMLGNSLQPAASVAGQAGRGRAARGGDRSGAGAPRRCILKNWRGLRTSSMPESRPVWYSSPGNTGEITPVDQGSPSSLTGADRAGAAAGLPNPAVRSAVVRPTHRLVEVPAGLESCCGPRRWVRHPFESLCRHRRAGGRGVGSARAPMSVHQADPASNQPLLEVVPLGGLGEFGLNSMAVSYADTLIAIDAGSMFPEPELLGIDLIVPDFSYLFERAGQDEGARADARARRPHRRGALRREAVRRADLRYADDARPGRGEARRARHRRRGPPRAGPAARPFHRGRSHPGVPAGHAQHARTAWRWPSTRRSA